jgi:hypothetical protein
MSEYDDELELEDVLEMARDAWLNEVHTVLPARVLRYDAASQTCSARPMVRRALPTVAGALVHETLPDVHGVPVCWPSAGPWFVHMPLAAGHTVLLACAERDYARWRQTGEVGDSTDIRNHALSFAFAIPGARSRRAALGDVPADALVVGKDGGATIRIKDNGDIDIGTNATEFGALANLVKARLDAIQSSYDAHKHSFAGTGTVGPVDTPIGALADVAASKARLQ